MTKYVLRQQGEESAKGDTEPPLRSVRTCWAAWPRPRRLAQFLCLPHRCWWIHPWHTRSSGTATAPSSLSGTQSCGISLPRSKPKIKEGKISLVIYRSTFLFRELLTLSCHIINSGGEKCLDTQGLRIEKPEKWLLVVPYLARMLLGLRTLWINGLATVTKLWLFWYMKFINFTILFFGGFYQS